MSRSFFLLFANTFCFVFAQFNQCELEYKIKSVGQTIAVNYPGSARPGTSCRYQIVAPVDSTIEASCSFNIPETSSDCLTYRLWISRSGDKEIRDANFYCGRGSIFQRSIGNEIVIALTQNRAGSPNFQCTFKSVMASCDCGWNARSRIVGGSAAGVNEFVSHAGLVDQRSKDVFCGATIISQFWAVTAAHCFDAFPNVRTTALLAGDHDLTTGSDTIWAALYLLEKYVKHENYNSDTNANDIALIKTRDYIKFNRGVGPACLPYSFMQDDQYFDGKYLTAVGWGTTEFGGPSSKILKKASLQVVSTQTCALKNKFFDRSKICTNENQSGSSCQKDSGGALYWSGTRQYFIGIISYGTYCASNIPSVNTRVTSYIGWIERNVVGFLCRKS